MMRTIQSGIQHIKDAEFSNPYFVRTAFLARMDAELIVAQVQLLQVRCNRPRNAFKSFQDMRNSYGYSVDIENTLRRCTVARNNARYWHDVIRVMGTME